MKIGHSKSIEDLKALPMTALLQNVEDWMNASEVVAEHLYERIKVDSLLRKVLAINNSGVFDPTATEPDYYIRSEFLMRAAGTVGEQFDQAFARSLKELVGQENSILAKLCDLMAKHSGSVVNCDRITPAILHEACKKAGWRIPHALVCGSTVYEQVREFGDFAEPERNDIVLGRHSGLLIGFGDGQIKVLTDAPNYVGTIDSQTAYLLPFRDTVGVLNLRTGLELRTLDKYPEARLEAGWFCSQVQSCRMNPAAVIKVEVGQPWQ